MYDIVEVYSYRHIFINNTHYFTSTLLILSKVTLEEVCCYIERWPNIIYSSQGGLISTFSTLVSLFYLVTTVILIIYQFSLSVNFPPSLLALYHSFFFEFNTYITRLPLLCTIYSLFYIVCTFDYSYS